MLMNKAFYFPVILQLIGVLVVIAEIILPSGGILSILATGLFGYSLYLVFTYISSSAGLAFIMADLILIPFLVYFGIKFLAKSPVTLRARLAKKDGVTSQSPEQENFLGSQGRAITDLRPSGVALIDEERVDVVTRGEYIEKHTKVVVIAVSGNRIIVKQIDN
jgi:membrane-bound serine protease (ClpP class)